MRIHWNFILHVEPEMPSLNQRMKVNFSSNFIGPANKDETGADREVLNKFIKAKIGE